MQVTIIGAGIAGLTASNYLHRAGVGVQMLEATDSPGGRIKTEEKKGFLLDRGFQVFLTAYPEARQLLDYRKLDLQTFLPGAILLQQDGSRDRIGDPLRDFSSLLPTLTASVGGFGDKLRILRLKMRLAGMSIDEIFRQENKTTLRALREDYGFGDKIIDRFFAPFFSGIFLETELLTSRRMFDFVFKMFGEGDAAVPRAGMQQIPLQLADNLPAGSILFNKKAEKIEGGTVTCTDGSIYTADKILVATEATGLISELKPTVKTRFVSTTHVHFTTDKAPLEKGIIALNTDKNRLVNNVCVINKVSDKYAPAGQHLISLSVVGKRGFSDENLERKIKTELKKYFGEEVEKWQHLDTRHVEYALPEQKEVQHDLGTETQKITDKLYVCGDFLLNGSINAAMKTGRKAAEMIGC